MRFRFEVDKETGYYANVFVAILVLDNNEIANNAVLFDRNVQTYWLYRCFIIFNFEINDL